MTAQHELLTREDGPQLVVDATFLNHLDDSPGRAPAIPPSRMFEIRNALDFFVQHNPGRATFDASQGDGGASLPGVPQEIMEQAFALQTKQGTGYDQPLGAPAFRKAVAEDYWQLDSATGWGTNNVVACQGGRDALLKAYDAICALGTGRRGDIFVTSRVPWVSYNWGPCAIGADVMLAPGDEADGWAMTPEGLRECVSLADKLGGRRVAGLIITSPDNPTGRTVPLEEQIALARAALELGISYVIFDWIYHRVTDGLPHDINVFLEQLSPAERDRVIILDGLTKSLGASNIRNAHLVAPPKIVEFIKSRASHGVIPSFFAQAVGIVAYRMGFDKAAAPIIEPTNASRQVLRGFLADKGMRAILGKGYYAFIDLGPWIERGGMRDSEEIGSYLARQHGLAVVPGVHFSRFGRNWIRFSYALPPEETRKASDRMWEALQAVPAV